MFGPKFLTRTLPGLALAGLALAACSDNPLTPKVEDAAPAEQISAAGTTPSLTHSTVFPDDDYATLQGTGGYSKNLVHWYSANKFYINFYVKDTGADGKCVTLYNRIRFTDGTYTPWDTSASRIACGKGDTNGGMTPAFTFSKKIYQMQFKLVVGGTTVDTYNVAPGD